MRKISLLLLLVLALPATAAVTGDPIDGNECPPTYSIDSACEIAATYPQCVPCLTTCIFAIMAEVWTYGDWNWDW